MAFSVKLFTALFIGCAVCGAEEGMGGSIQFAADLFKVVGEDFQNENVVISPLSVKTALGLLMTGAEGDTANEISRGLHLSGFNRAELASYFEELMNRYNGKSMDIANKVFTQKGFSLKPSFNDVARKSFKSEAESLDFGNSALAADVVNSWVSKKTNGKIAKLFESDSFSDATRMVLANAVYFKDAWQIQFNKSDTRKMPFWLNEEESVMVDMMYNHFAAALNGRIKALNADAILLPYDNSELMMLILIPDTRSGLSELEAKLSTYDFTKLFEDVYDSEVYLNLPKFEIESSIKLKEVLIKMGMGTMFTDFADFSNLLDTNEPLAVGKAVHKAYLKVDEEGTEASGATGFEIIDKMGPVPPKTITVDRPFFFAIFGSNDVPFIGSVKRF